MIGSHHGAVIGFADKRINGIRIGRTQLHIGLVESFEGATPTDAPEETARTLDTQNRSFTSTLTERVTARQALTGGHRDIILRNQLETLLPTSPKADKRVIFTEVQFVFEVDAPTVWTLHMQEPATVTSVEPLALRIAVNPSTRMTWEAPDGVLRAPKPEPGTEGPPPTWSFALPAGRTEITLRLRAGGWRDIADLVVICRPEQMREAAIALAAIPDKRFVPLMVLQPPPMKLAELRQLFSDFHPRVDRVLGEMGAFGLAEFSGKTSEEKDAFMADWALRRELQQRMHPYRSWAKRNSMLHKALRDFSINKAICLFEPTPQDLALAGIEYALEKAPPDSEDLSGIPSLLDDVEQVILASCVKQQGLDAVFDECARIHAGLTRPVLEVADDPASVLVGLCEARSTGHTLRIKPGATHDPGLTRSYGTATAQHVVAVEVEDDARALTASLFAAHLHTQLLTLPKPDLTDVDHTLRDLQQAVVEHARDSTWLSHLSATVHQYLTGDRRPALLQELEKQVTRCVPPTFIHAVGGHALTVFGSGLPYGFVKLGRTNWSSKHIGHVIADPDLIIISELHNTGAIDPIVSFNLIIDPGFFQCSETDVVAEALQARPAKSLVLRKDAQIANLLPRLIGTVPLDFIFFNTHGSDDAIMLGFYPLQHYQITQWFEFDQRPLIFNNSCLSWTGVGRDFVRIGARGYIGTLWSVGAQDAATLAEQAMARMIHTGEPVCSAILPSAKVDPFTSRAYVFVGTADATFAMDREEQLSEDDPIRLIAVMQNLLVLLNVTRRQMNANEADAFTSHTYGEFKVLREGLMARGEAYLKSVIADSMLAEIEMHIDKDDVLHATPNDRLALVDRCRQIVQEAPLSEADRDHRLARLLFHRADINRLRGHFAEADDDAKHSMDVDQKQGESGRSALQVRIQIAIDNGRIDDALSLAKQAQSKQADTDNGNDIDIDNEPQRKSKQIYELMTLGRLCQIMKRQPDHLDEGIELAKKGVQIATDIDNLAEVATFELDLAQLHLQKGQVQLAIDAAQRSLTTSRRGQNAIGELGAYGTLGQCHAQLGHLAQARTYALRGLERAQQLNEPRRVAAFLNDLANIEWSSGDRHLSTDYRIEGMRQAAEMGHIDMWQLCIQVGVQACGQVQDAGEGARMISAAIQSLGLATQPMLPQGVSILLSSLPHLLGQWPQPNRLDLLQDLLAATQPVMESLKDHPQPKGYAELLFAMGHAFLLHDMGQTEPAQQLTHQIDAALGANGGFQQVMKHYLG